jgi:Type II secretion system (T2SS), protein M
MKWPSLANVQHAYARLAPRERLFVAAGGAAFLVFLVFLAVYETQSAKSAIRQRIVAKQHQLEKVQTLSATYLDLKRQTETLMAKEAGRAPNWLYSTLDGLVAKNLSRDKVSSMAPSSKTIGEQYVEESVNVQLIGITLPQTVTLLYEIEQSASPIHVARLQMKKRVTDPYQFDVSFTASSIKTAS